MTILQVKKYHASVAAEKEQKALDRWQKNSSGSGYPVQSMFYFFKIDKQGYPTEKRKNGYVAFDENRACFNLNPIKAISAFNS